VAPIVAVGLFAELGAGSAGTRTGSVANVDTPVNGAPGAGAALLDADVSVGLYVLLVPGLGAGVRLAFEGEGKAPGTASLELGAAVDDSFNGEEFVLALLLVFAAVDGRAFTE